MLPARAVTVGVYYGDRQRTGYRQRKSLSRCPISSLLSETRPIGVGWAQNWTTRSASARTIGTMGADGCEHWSFRRFGKGRRQDFSNDG